MELECGWGPQITNKKDHGNGAEDLVSAILIGHQVGPTLENV